MTNPELTRDGENLSADDIKRVCMVCGAFLGGNPNGTESHGLCEGDLAVYLGQIELMKQRRVA